MLRVFVMVYTMICKKALPPAGESFIASATVNTVWTGTQEQYDAITTKDANTLYFIEESSP